MVSLTDKKTLQDFLLKEISKMKETKFKDTEVGRIPEDWEVKALGDVFSVGNGKDYIHLSFGDIPVYGTGGYMTSVSDYLHDGETVCIGRKGTIDEPQYHTGKIWTVDTLFYTYGFQNICVKYLFYLFNRIDWKKYNEATGVPSLTSKNILAIIAQFPKLSEQTRIATALSNIDALISELGRLIEKKRGIKQGAMQQLLTGKKRLKGFTEPWVEKKLGAISSIYDGTHQTPHYVDNGVPFYSVENVTANNFFNTKYISEKEHELLSSRVKIEQGDVLMTRIGSIGKCKYIDWKPKASFYVSLALIKCVDSVDSKFISYYSNSKQFRNEIELRSLFMAIPQKINLGPISEILMIIPPSREEQSAIASVLSSMDEEISALESKKVKYE